MPPSHRLPVGVAAPGTGAAVALPAGRLLPPAVLAAVLTPVLTPVLAVVLAVVLAAAGAAAPAAASPSGAAHEQVAPHDRPAVLVAAEDARLATARQLLPGTVAPFRFTSGGAATLVLPPRPTPYGLADLRTLAPQTFVEQAPGTYLLREHLVVAAGATLALTRAGGLALRLSSGADGFVSVVGLGGRLSFTGTAAAPVTLTSWDVGRQVADSELDDGRAYVRAVGGQLQTDHLQVSALGFWSGRTGGIAVTGSKRSDLTDEGDLDQAPDTAPAPAAPLSALVAPAGPVVPGVPVPLRPVDAGAALGPSRISATTIDGDAYGLFVSGARGLQVLDSTVRRSAVAGVVLHRDASDARIERTTVTDGAGDGVRVDRGSSGVVLTRVTAIRNGRNGITVVGGAQAAGPSATGGSTRSSGGTTVRDSAAEQNGRYGIEVQGGDEQRVEGNTVSGSGTGVLVTGPAQRAVVSANTVTGATGHAIALVDGVRDAVVESNVVSGSTDGVYLRGSSARVVHNTVRAAARHGVTLVGDVDGSSAGGNTLSGTGQGTAAVDSVRATGRVTWTPDDVTDFDDTTSVHHWMKILLHPMNVLWLMIALLLLASALRSRVHRRAAPGHPYAHQMSHHHLPALPPVPAAPAAGPSRAAGAPAATPVRAPEVAADAYRSRDRHAAPVAAP